MEAKIRPYTLAHTYTMSLYNTFQVLAGSERVYKHVNPYPTLTAYTINSNMGCTSSKPPKDADGLRFYENTVSWANRDNSASAASHTRGRPYPSELRGSANNGQGISSVFAGPTRERRYR
jgi:hypothetical protein